MKLFNKYTKEIHRELGYYASWTPGVEIKLGDVGYLKGKLFIVKSNLSHLGLSFKIKEDKKPVSLSHSSKGQVEVTLKGSGSAPITGSTLTEIEAGFCVKMKKQNSIFLEANNVLNHSIENQLALGKEILRRFNSKNPKEKWDKDLVVVTEIAQAGSCTILISKSNDNVVDITAKGKLSASDLNIAQADLGLSVKSSKSLETKFLGEKGLVPMFRLSKIKTKMFKKVFENFKLKTDADFFESNEDLNNAIEEFTVFEDIDIDEDLDNANE